MADLICYENYPFVALGFRTNGVRFSLGMMFDAINRDLFNNAIDMKGGGHAIAGIINDETEEGRARIARNFRERTLACTDGKIIQIHPDLARRPFPEDLTSITKALAHEMVHILVNQENGEMLDHGEEFRDVVHGIDEKLGMEKTVEKNVPYWPIYNIPLEGIYCDLIRWKEDKSKELSEALLSEQKRAMKLDTLLTNIVFTSSRQEQLEIFSAARGF